MYVTLQKSMSVFMKKLSLRELFIRYLRIVCFPTILDTRNSCFCIRQVISVVMPDNIVLNANFVINKLGAFNLYSDLQEGEVIYGKYVCAYIDLHCYSNNHSGHTLSYLWCSWISCECLEGYKECSHWDLLRVLENCEFLRCEKVKCFVLYFMIYCILNVRMDTNVMCEELCV
jgi:hypothetical protein